LGKGWIYRHLPVEKTYMSLGFVGWACLGWRMTELKWGGKVGHVHVVHFECSTK
jgi:hypothetical protein